jgi:DNA repair protein RadA/Sms
MAKAATTTLYVCQSCGASSRKWVGKCEACGEWNTLVEESATPIPKGLTPGKGKGLATISLAEPVALPERRMTGIGELDRTLGGGLVEGSATLIGGDPGIGKSTLLLQAAAALARKGATTTYITGEESAAQVQLRAERLGAKAAPVSLAAATSVRDILATIDQKDAPEIVIIDSIQTMFIDALDSAPGTVAQVRASAQELIRAAKKRGFALILVGHVTKDGQIAGPRVLEHMVDTVLYFEGDRGHQYRILRAVKNRFGATDEIGVFNMSDRGLEEVKNPSALFLEQRDHAISGAAVFAGMEGTRPLLMEIQALVSPSPMTNPRRATVGFDSGRLAMVLAVLETRAGMRLADKEVFLNVAGGLKISEPGADLAAALALLSALLDTPLPRGLIAVGEIGLTGEIRSVSRMEARLKEAEKLGFTAALIPAAATRGISLGNRPLTHVEELVRYLREL